MGCLADNFRKAANLCERLAREPRRGPIYTELRECLGLLEGACRQAAAWRGDARWLQIGLMMAEAHKRAGNWLRGYRNNEGYKVTLAQGHLHPLFVKLADNLRAAEAKAQEVKTKKTGKLGLILPRPLPAPHRDTRPVHISRSGLILPRSVVA